MVELVEVVVDLVQYNHYYCSRHILLWSTETFVEEVEVQYTNFWRKHRRERQEKDGKCLVFLSDSSVCVESSEPNVFPLVKAPSGQALCVYVVCITEWRTQLHSATFRSIFQML